MSNTDNIEALKTQLYEAEAEYSWEQKGTAVIGKNGHLITWAAAILLGSLFPSFLLIVEDDAIYQPGFWLFSSFSLVMIFVSRYLFLPDKHRCYQLTSIGIHYTEQDLIPEVAYKIARGFAWVGIVVCIIAVVVLGPLAFVGAGAFALMSFGMTNFQSTVDKSYVFMDGRTILFDLIGDHVLSFTVPGKGQMQYKGLVFTSNPLQKEELLSNIKLIFPDIEVIKIKRLNDQYKHPIYLQDEEVVK